MLFSPVEIQETVNMFMRQKLDIRCITMGISLLDCADSDAHRACDKIYDKIMKKAGNLVKVGQDIEKEFGVPIINKRIEVKRDSTAKKAIEQIQAKEYTDRFRLSGKPITLIGMAFSTKKRAVSSVKIVREA